MYHLIEPLEARIAPATLISIAGPQAFAEGNTGTKQIAFVVTLSEAAPEGGLTVDYATSNGTAIAEDDYSSATGELTFAAGETQKTISVSVKGDTTGEADETFSVLLSDPSTGSLDPAQSSAQATILNDEPRISIESQSISEGPNGVRQMTFTVRLSEASTETVTVMAATKNDTATTADGDYVARNPTLLTFAANAGPEGLTQTFTVDINSDTKYETDERFLVTLSQPTHAVLDSALSSATGTILNDDSVPVVSIGQSSITEGGQAKFTVSLSNKSYLPVIINYSTVDGSGNATVGSDYTAVGGTLVFAPDELTKTISVNTNDDVVYEPGSPAGTAETFQVVISSDNENATVSVESGTGTGTINDNDSKPSLNIGDVTVVEGNGPGASQAIFKVTLSAPSTQTVKVTAKTADSTALSASDYTALTTDLVFAPGETVKEISVAISGDLTGETDETFFVRLSSEENATVARPQAIGTISNDEATFRIGNAVAIVEGNDGTRSAIFEVTLLTPITGAQAEVGYETEGDTAQGGTDYTATTGTLTFLPARPDPANPGQTLPAETMKTIAVPILGDTLFEKDEVFKLKLKNPVGATLFETGTGIGTITNDDAMPLVSIGNGTVQEGGPGEKKVVNFTVTLSAVSSEAVTVKYVTMDGTATVANGDYTASGSQTLTFAPGETTKTISVEVNGDATVELDEAFKVQLSNATQATLGTSVGTATILNDDGATVVIRNNGTPVVVTEGSGPNATRFAQFVVELADAGDAPVTVTYSTVDGTAKSADGDFTAVTNQTLTFAAGETSKLVSIPILADAFGEGTENFTIKLNSATNASLVTGRDTITATILDDEPTISVGDVTVIEGSNGTSSAVFTVKLNKAATGNVVVNYQTEDGTAVDGMVVEGGAAEPAADYTRSLGSITFLPGQTTQTITVPVTADMALEGSETFRLKLTLAADSEARLADGEAVATIKESTLSVGAVTVVEGSGGVKQAVFTVKLSDPLGSAVSVAYNTEDGTAAGGSDFTAVTGGSLTFAPGETEKTVSIPILGDLAHEASETFKLKLSGASAGLGTAEALGTITDDDPVPRISIDNQAVLEGSPDGVRQAEFTLRLSAASSETITVLVATKDGTATTVDNDYVGKTQTVTFAPGELTQKFVVDVISDTRGEADEAFTLNLSAPTNATLGAASQATGTITNDDLSLSITSPGTVIEGGTGSFTVRLSGPSTESVTVNYTTQSGTAAEGVDYETAKGTVVFAPGETVKTIDVKSKADTGSEANETFVVLLSNALNAGISVDKATASITDQKALLSIGDVSIVEGDSGELIQTFTVTRSGGDLSAATTVDWATGDGTAKDGVNEAFADYEAASGTLTFAAGETSKTFTVKIKGDILKEGNEAFQVSLSNAQNASIVKGVATATIVEEAGDNAIGISVKDAKVVEGALGTKASAVFRVELSAVSELPISFTAATVRGISTAVPGTDYTELLPKTFTIAQGLTFVDVPVEVLGNNAFEDGVTKTFELQLSDISSNLVPVAGVDQKATGFIFNDDMLFSSNGRVVQYMDVDGDVATLKISKGQLLSRNLTFGTKSAVGGQQLQLIDLSNQPQFSKANISVTARPALGFPTAAEGGAADGLVNVGWIKAVIPDQGLFRFTGGVDLGSVTIEGDLARIDSGDKFTSAALRKLEVNSFGAVSGTMPLDSSNAPVVSQSLVLSSIGKMVVHGDFAGELRLYGGRFGDIGSIKIEGNLGPVQESDYGLGLISFPGKLNNAVIGSIVGGTDPNSAQILGDVSSGAAIGSITVLGSITGGSGASSGLIQAVNIGTIELGSLQGGSGLHAGTVIANNGRIGNVIVHGDVTGATSGSVSTSTESAVSGSIFSSLGIGKVLIEGNLQGGISPNSGTVETSGSLGSIVVGKSVIGGTGNDSGGILANETIGRITIEGDIQGGNSGTSQALVRSGFIKAAQMTSITVNGNLIAGTDGGSGTIAASGAILALGEIGSLNIAGSVEGNTGFSALISAGSFKSITLATTEGASVRFAEILAGYRDVFTADSQGKILGSARFGTASNPGAQIGKVVIGGNIEATDIVAGALPGTDGRFGSLDDLPQSNSNPLLSRIASVVVKGVVVPTASRAYGVVAQRIDSIEVAGVSGPLIPQPGSPIVVTPIVPDSNWNAVRLKS